MPNPTKPKTNLTREELEQKIFQLTVSTGQEFMKTRVLKDWTLSKDIMQLIDTYTQAKGRESLENVTRFEVIDHRQCFWCRGRKTANVLQKNGNYKEKPCDKCHGSGTMGGRVYGAFSNAETSIIQIEQSFQDDGRTLKVFVKDRENL